MFDHLAAIKSGSVTKTTVIGLRKALNADARRCAGYSTSSTAPTMSGEELLTVMRALAEHEPQVVGELHESGLALLRSPRYRRRLEHVQSIIDGLVSFHLVGYDRIGYGLTFVPCYKAVSMEGSFTFHNIPWQSGGNGPEVFTVKFTK